MDFKEPNKCSHVEKMKGAMQLKRRDRQSQISAHGREALLLSRRIRRQDSAKHNLLQNPIVAVPEYWNKARFLKQTALTIQEPPSLPEKSSCHPSSLRDYIAG